MEKLLQVTKAGEQFYGLYRYGSFFTAAREKDRELRIHTNLVYAFKEFGKHQARIKVSIELAQQLLNCQHIVIAPPSTPKPNALQTMFSCGVFTRRKTVASRKYNHKAEIDTKEQLASLSCNYNSLGAGTILLVDDVITSGKTILFFRDLLVAAGYDVIMFGLGLRDTLKPQSTEYEYQIPELSEGEIDALLDEDLFSISIGKQHRVVCHTEEEIELVNYKADNDYASVKRAGKLSKLVQLLNLELSLYRLQAKLDSQEFPDSEILESQAKVVKLLYFTRIKM